MGRMELQKADIKSFINNFKTDHNQYPSIKAVATFGNMPYSTAQVLRKQVLEEMRQEVLDHFSSDLIPRTEELLAVVEQNKKMYKELRDESTLTSDKIAAAKAYEDACTTTIGIMRDGPEYLELNDDKNVTKVESEHVHGGEEPDKEEGKPTPTPDKRDSD